MIPEIGSGGSLFDYQSAAQWFPFRISETSETLDIRGIRHTWGMIYGLEQWGDCFSPRQLLALTTLTDLSSRIAGLMTGDGEDQLSRAIQTGLALVLDRQADALSSLVTWTPAGEFQGHTFVRQALPMVWDFAEVNPWCESSGNYMGATEWVSKVCESAVDLAKRAGHAEAASATSHPLPDDAAQALITDPPYYDAVPYSYLSDFFYVWLRRSLGRIHPELFGEKAVPKEPEIVVDRPHELSNSTHDIAYYERELTRAFADSRRVLQPDGVGTIVFASKTTASWEAILQAVVDAGWTITDSWPIDTEREARVSAQGQARLASSVHLVCRPRPDAEAAQSGGRELASGISNIGDWRDVLAELPARIHAWMPRLAQEGVVGADAIFACLGPALEIFSRYSRVEKASGDPVALREYLEHVWAAVSHEALTMIFEGADASGFEEDARLTAMWLWTLTTDSGDGGKEITDKEETSGEDAEGESRGSQAGQLYALEFDAARQIAQGLGAHLERLTSLVQVKGETARLLSVSERTRYLFGKEEAQAPGGRRAKPQQLGLFAALEEAEEGASSDAAWGASGASSSRCWRAG